MRTLIAKILHFKSQNTYYKWKKEGRPIISLLEKYFTENELEEFLQTGKIKKLENINSIVMVNESSFFLKLKKLDLNFDILIVSTSNPVLELFCNFIINYVTLKESYTCAKNKSIWIGTNNLHTFKAYFYEYLIKINCDSNSMVNMSTYINSLEISDLIYLNTSIQNGFTPPNILDDNFHIDPSIYGGFFRIMFKVLDIEVLEDDKSSNRELVNKKILELIQENILNGSLNSNK